MKKTTIKKFMIPLSLGFVILSMTTEPGFAGCTDDMSNCNNGYQNYVKGTEICEKYQAACKKCIASCHKERKPDDAKSCNQTVWNGCNAEKSSSSSSNKSINR